MQPESWEHAIDIFLFNSKIAKYATFNKKGILVYSCIDCDGTKKVYKKWKSGTDYSRNYDIKHGTVFNRQTSITVKLKRPSKGTVLQATIGTKKYKKKIKNNKKTVKLNIKPAEYGEKIKLALYYKGKKICIIKERRLEKIVAITMMKCGTATELRKAWHRSRYAIHGVLQAAPAAVLMDLLIGTGMTDPW